MKKVTNWSNFSFNTIKKDTFRIKEKVFRKIADIEKDDTIHFSSIITELENIQTEIQNVQSKINLINGILYNEKNSKELGKLDSIFHDIDKKIFNNIKIYQKICHLFSRKDNLNLSTEELRLLDIWMKYYINYGILLPTKEKNKVQKIEKDIVNLKRKFESNLMSEERKELGFKKEELDGLNENDLSLFEFKKNKYFIKNKEVLADTIIDYCHQKKTREKMSVLNKQKGKQLNKSICLQILKKRQEMAKLKNYNNHAELVLDDNRMNNNITELISKLYKLNKLLQPKIKEELKLINKKAKQLKIKEITNHDIDYIVNQMKKDLDIDSFKFKTLFSIESLLNGFFNIVKNKMNIKFIKVKIKTWDKKVLVFKCFHNNKLQGYLYLDLENRDNKQAGAWCDVISFGSKTSFKEILVTMDIIDPNEGLLFSNMETFFHEMGHAIHSLLCKDLSFSFNSNALEWDSVELQSQVMENLLMENWVLNKISKKRINPKILDKIKKSKTFITAINKQELILNSILDISIHKGQVSDLFALEDTLNKLKPYKVKNSYKITRFLHLFSHSYDAGYYSYIWSEVLDSNIYNKWKEDNFNKNTFNNYVQYLLIEGGETTISDKLNNYLNKDIELNLWAIKNGVKKKNV
jgi:peptidyl-dipeptidase Dcp